MSEGEKMKIAITGSIGSGKSSVGSYLREKGYTVIDTDKLVHEFYQSSNILYDAVLDVFGINILNESGEIDRRKLGSIVFENPLALNDLESIVFPAVENYIVSFPDNDLSFFEIPMLFESEMDSLFDSILMIDIDRDLSFSRLVNRGISKEDAQKRLEHQMSSALKIEKSDKVIHNNGTIDDLYHSIDLYLKEMGY